MTDYLQKLGQLESQLHKLKKEIELAPSKKGKRKVLIIYNSSQLKGSGKVSFFYGLKGRKNKAGILKETNAEFLSKGTLLCSPESFDKLAEFFKKWNCKCRILIIDVEKEVNGKL